MAHQISPSDLINKEEYELLKSVHYTEMKAFVLAEIRNKSNLLKVYGIVQLLAAIVLFAVLGYFIATSIHAKTISVEVKSMLWAAIFSFTLVIPIHEGLHAIAFLILGKRDISFGVQWRKFLFYAESNMQVLDRKQMILVALFPLIIISLLAIAAILFCGEMPCVLFCGTTVLIHLFFCSGDLTIISFFERHKPHEVFTFDNRKEKRTYYYQKTITIQ